MGVTCNRGEKVLFEKWTKRDKFISFVFFEEKKYATTWFILFSKFSNKIIQIIQSYVERKKYLKEYCQIVQ